MTLRPAAVQEMLRESEAKMSRSPASDNEEAVVMKQQRVSQMLGQMVCRGAWARVTMDQLRHSAFQTFEKHRASSTMFSNKVFKYFFFDRSARTCSRTPSRSSSR
jgi:hypothetical protein